MPAKRTIKPKKYDPKKIEPKWQKAWEKQGIYEAAQTSKKPKHYVLVEFPYLSADGLHTGHVRGYTAFDIVARKRRMQGYNVLFPIGWDAFGLPTENFAIKTGIHPAIITKRNADNFRKQLKMIGFSFDWSREINTSDPDYYKWTQWIFLQFFKKGFAYKAQIPINWCPKDKIGLANEEVVAGKCERCGTPVEKREKEQWMLKITAYAEKLLTALDTVDYMPQIRDQQVNWIGKREGLLFTAPVRDMDLSIQTFSSHFASFAADTFVVIAPDHPLLPKLLEGSPEKAKVLTVCKKMLNKRTERGAVDEKEIEGVFTGRYIIDPVGNGDLPIWVASFALADYGTGIVKCSAHDTRDFAFAKKYNIPLKVVLVPPDPALRKEVEAFEICYTDMENGILLEPAPFKGKRSGDVIRDIVAYCVKKKLAVERTSYKLRDWVFSRQHYWGEPIPIINCPACGHIPVPEKQLPVVLPNVKAFQPRDDGESPLASVTSWVKVKCPQCKGPAKRETDTMPNWAGSSWYFLRYIDHKNKKAFADYKKLQYWMPVDWYNGGMEHTVLHLLYSRFWTQFLYDEKLVPTHEPYRKRTALGIVLADDGRKMSKSFGNVVNPDSVVKSHGADTLRLYEMFMGPFTQAIPWNPQSIEGVHRFLHRVWTLAQEKRIEARTTNPDLYRLIHKTIKQVSEDVEDMGFNTAVSALMIFVNEATKADLIPLNIWKDFLRLLGPFAPHVAEELWAELPGSKKSVHVESWPIADESALRGDTITLVIQVNGKVRDRVEVASDITEEEAKAMALNRERVKVFVGAKTPARVIYVPGRLVNIVI